MDKNKIGIFGGAFNPVHNGHIHLAKAVLELAKLEKVLIIPTKVSPHKQSDLLDYKHRRSLLNLAFEGENSFEVSDIEQKIEGKNYTIKTIIELKKLYKNIEFSLIMGGDMLLYFKQWYHYEDVLRQCRIIVAARHEKEYEKLVEFANELDISRISILEIPVVEISSTQIRKLIKNDGNYAEFMPNKCAEYISDYKLFMESDKNEADNY